MEDSKIILCIPGLWKNRREIVEAVARQSEGYIFAGNSIGKLGETINFFDVEVYEYDEHLTEAFEIAGNGKFSEEQLDCIKNHFLTVYLVGEGGSIDKVVKMVEAAHVLLKSGGLGVKVESSGTANTIEEWSHIYNTNDTVDLFKAFVTVVEETDFYYTCGMHCFGLPDVITFKNQVTTQYAQDLMQIFCLYNLIERPELENGSTFSIDENSLSFILRYAECRHFPEDHVFYNKYGIWALVKKST
ncbi:DUF4261 domain-containing protein [Bacillus rhizoplanae]|uniref:DUF4261 domain-containing protein n=1 Tax=Bacillus rhizoplanae TaxID=2880966 RepID=UPI003D25D8A8